MSRHNPTLTDYEKIMKTNMFRLKFYRNITRKVNFSDLNLQKTLIPGYLTQIQCLSNVNFAKNFSENDVRSKPKHETMKLSQNTQINSDQQFMLHLKDDPDTFGGPKPQEIIDESDILEEKHFTEQVSPSQKLRTKQYADIIKDHIKKHKIKEAIDVLELRMLKDDKVKPEAYIYNLILGACGRVGYTKKAFMLYNQMKKRGLKVMGGTYTALFNACANSPWPDTDGLTRAKGLREIMLEKGHEPNDTTYNSMIKAFGRGRDLNTAFALVDEMRAKRISIKINTINFLLQACISDEEAGFRHALLVWRKLVNKKIQPDLYSFNLMLRCIRDCGLGDIDVTKDVIEKLLGSVKHNNDIKLLENRTKFSVNMESELGIGNGNKRLNKNKLEVCVEPNSNKIIINNDSVCKATEICNKPESTYQHGFEVSTIKNTNKLMASHVPIDNSTILQTVETNMKEQEIMVDNNEISNARPNLMAPVPHLGNIISLNEVKKAEDRLILVGGCSGFLEQMQYHKCTPDIKTFTQLLDCIPNTSFAEKEMLVALKKNNVKPDLDFYNMLIKKRSMRFDYEGAKEVLKSMKQMKYRPNLITYGVLALGCKTKDEALDLIQQMRLSSYRLNAEILGAMLSQACYHENFSYILEILEICLRENVQPNKKFMEHLKEFHSKCKEKIYAKNFSKPQEKAFFLFKTGYKDWLQEIQMDDSEDAHPWQQYRQNSTTEPKSNLKDSARFKPRHNSKFKVKTSTKQRY